MATTISAEDNSISRLHEYFLRVGVDFRTAPKSINYNDRLGMLMVRATAAELELVEQAAQTLNAVRPQIRVDVQFYGVSDESIKALGLAWLLSSMTNRQSAISRAGGKNSGYLTPQEYVIVSHALQQREGVTFFSTPQTLTQSGRQAHIKAAEVRTIVPDIDQNAGGFGGLPAGLRPPDVLRRFSLFRASRTRPGDRCGPIRLRRWLHDSDDLIPTLKEFVGYDLNFADTPDLWDYVESPGANPSPKHFAAEPIQHPFFDR